MHVAFERVFFLKKVSENKKTAVLIERKPVIEIWEY